MDSFQDGLRASFPSVFYLEGLQFKELEAYLILEELGDVVDHVHRPAVGRQGIYPFPSGVHPASDVDDIGVLLRIVEDAVGSIAVGRDISAELLQEVEGHPAGAAAFVVEVEHHPLHRGEERPEVFLLVAHLVTVLDADELRGLVYHHVVGGLYFPFEGLFHKVADELHAILHIAVQRALADGDALVAEQALHSVDGKVVCVLPAEYHGQEAWGEDAAKVLVRHVLRIDEAAVGHMHTGDLVDVPHVPGLDMLDDRVADVIDVAVLVFHEVCAGRKLVVLIHLDDFGLVHMAALFGSTLIGLLPAGALLRTRRGRCCACRGLITIVAVFVLHAVRRAVISLFPGLCVICGLAVVQQSLLLGCAAEAVTTEVEDLILEVKDLLVFAFQHRVLMRDGHAKCI